VTRTPTAITSTNMSNSGATIGVTYPVESTQITGTDAFLQGVGGSFLGRLFIDAEVGI